MFKLIDKIHLETDSTAEVFEKGERVEVRFAVELGTIESREGANRYRPGDAVVTGSTGDEWTVSRERFDSKYRAVAPLRHGQAGLYDNIPVPVLAKQIDEPFKIERSAGGDWITGEAMDWLVQYAAGDFGIVQDAKFQAVYRRLRSQSI